MSRASESIEDLLVLARRGVLSEPELRRLQVYLGSADGARQLYEAGVDYDALRTEQPSDAALTAKLSQRVQARYARAAPVALWFKARALRAGLVVLGLTGAAAAGHWVGPLIERSKEVSPAPQSAALASAQSQGLGHASRRRLPRPAATNRKIAEQPPMAHSARAPEPHRAAPQGSAAVVSSLPPRRGAEASLVPGAGSGERAAAGARQLFSRANRQRKAGRTEQAISLYRELQHRFPSSPEASLSCLVVGRLQLGRGQASLAQTQFDRYLARHSRGALAEEALHGKAQALRGQGRSAAERHVWRQLLRRFPDSVYVPTARERLGLTP